jgi:hypothetical protein
VQSKTQKLGLDCKQKLASEEKTCRSRLKNSTLKTELLMSW